MMPVEPYRLALSRDGGPEIDARGAYELRDGVTVYGRYVNNWGTRIAGSMLMLVSGLATVALAVVGGLLYGDQADLDHALPWWVGADGTFVTMCIGLGVSFAWDHAEIRVIEPGASP